MPVTMETMHFWNHKKIIKPKLGVVIWEKMNCQTYYDIKTFYSKFKSLNSKYAIE